MKQSTRVLRSLCRKIGMTKPGLISILCIALPLWLMLPGGCSESPITTQLCLMNDATNKLSSSSTAPMMATNATGVTIAKSQPIEPTDSLPSSPTNPTPEPSSGHVASNDIGLELPAPSCDQGILIARYRPLCGSGNQVPQLDQRYGIQAEQLISCATIQQHLTLPAPPAIRLKQSFRKATRRLESYVLLRKRGNLQITGQAPGQSYFTKEDVAALEEAGFDRGSLEYSCPMTIMQDSPSPRPLVPLDDATVRNKAVNNLATKALGANIALSQVATNKPWHLAKTGLGSIGESMRTKACAGGNCPSIKVAVLDSGIDAGTIEHWQKEFNDWPVVVKGVWNFQTRTKDGSLTDEAGHGTAVAGFILQASEATAELLSIRVLDGMGTGYEHNLVAGIEKALAEKADILNMSFGFLARDKTTGRNGAERPQYLADLLETALASGVRIFAAAGNTCGGPEDRTCQYYPAALGLKGLVSVGGMSYEGKPSQRGVTGIDMYAPSELLCASVPEALSSDFSLRLSGSSFATAQVSGAMALLTSWYAAEVGRALSSADREALLGALTGGKPLSDRLDLCQTITNLSGSGLGRDLPQCSSWARQTASPAEEECSSWVPRKTSDEDFFSPACSPPSASSVHISPNPGESSINCSDYDPYPLTPWYGSHIHTAPLVPFGSADDCSAKKGDPSFDPRSQYEVRIFSFPKLEPYCTLYRKMVVQPTGSTEEETFLYPLDVTSVEGTIGTGVVISGKTKLIEGTVKGTFLRLECTPPTGPSTAYDTPTAYKTCI